LKKSLGRGRRRDRDRVTQNKDSATIFGGFAISRKSASNVMPAKAGIQKHPVVTKALGPGFRRGDHFLWVHHFSKWW